MQQNNFHPERDDFQPLEEKPSKAKKIIILLMGLFLLLLITTYFLLGPQILHILEGKIESTQISNDFTAKYINWTIEFSPESFNELQQYYLQNQKTEISVCLQGIYQQSTGTYSISSIYYPKIIEKAFDHVIFSNCPQETIIVLHTHPYKSCIFSDQDIKSYDESKQINEDIMIALMCEENRLTFYKE